ncbi:FAD-dependent oxidoreductase [Agrobacterium tumefaciens]|uniref:NAD(P)/FAD-dependent oxidoreductase n=1 Tax=Agrobacterium tumefaciens TaxID=358 RepID=UPI001573355C|nr:NAD(P)/FAD-dependent oxidoreductase [Agrobacterium tumefaciens]NTA50702.1 FAD-dependent oxidoreductase [Agrobacterium tumefaciens]
MNRHVDLLIVGAGPAGMSAAILAKRYGVDALIVDEQPTPGGQIWRNIEAVMGTPRAEILGKSYAEGYDVVQRFRASGVDYRPRTQVWQVQPGHRAFMVHDSSTVSVDTPHLLLATGAQERPAPFPGWTLPGVMTVGAAQILLKTSGQIPTKPVWIAGNGPLPLLYATQLLNAGGEIAGYLDTAAPVAKGAAIKKATSALLATPGDLLKGMGWIASLRRRISYVSNVIEMEALGDEKVQSIRYVTAQGESKTVDAEVLLIHEGVVPSIHATLALSCQHRWVASQNSYAPELDSWGETSENNVFVAGDGAGIGGAAAACLRGELAALRITAKVGRISHDQAEHLSKPLRSRLHRLLASRPFLDTIFVPRRSIFAPPDQTVVCRCEEVNAATIRSQVSVGRSGPNQVKAFTRAGMGPCQGRQCNYTVANILADVKGCSVADLGLYRVRPPMKPVTLGALSRLDSKDLAQ